MSLSSDSGVRGTCKSAANYQSDGEVRAEIVRLVDSMTSTGQRSLDDKQIRALKLLCRRSDDYVRHVYYLLMNRLEKHHAEIRLSAFQIAAELFVRSHCFRDLLLSDCQRFLELVLAINPKQPLPAPKWAAVELKQQAVRAIKQWHDSFGKTYKKLSIAYNFLKSSKKVDFANILAASESERQRLEQTAQRQEAKNRLQLNKILQEMEGSSADITSCITQAENCMSLLLSDDLFSLAAHDGNSITDAFSHWRDVEQADKRLDWNDGHDELTDHDGQFQTECRDTELLAAGHGEGLVPLTSTATSCMHHAEEAHERWKNNERLQGLGEVDYDCDSKLHRDANCGVSGARRARSSDESIASPAADADTNEQRKMLVNCDSEFRTDHGNEIFAAGRLADKSRSSHESSTDVDVIDREETSKRLDVDEGLNEPINCRTEFQSDHGDAVDEVSAAGGLADEAKSSDESMTEDNTGDDGQYEVNSRRQHGVHSFRYALHIDIASHIRVEHTEDNADVIRTLQELTTLLVNRHIPTVKRWLEVLSKVGAVQEHVRKALDVKSSIEATVSRVRKLNIISITDSQQTVTSTSHDADSDDDDDAGFIEVADKEGFEPTIPEHQREEYGLTTTLSTTTTAAAAATMSWQQKEHQLDVEDPTSLAASVIKRQQLALEQQKARDIKSADVVVDPEPSTSSAEPHADGDCCRQKLLQRAPVISYGSDLCFWGDNFELPLINRNSTDTHRWWSAKEQEDAVDTNALEASKSRVISFVGEFERVKWKCRAPLPNGNLCERMDRRKCPFHGKIVARDEHGVIANPPPSSSSSSAAAATGPHTSQPSDASTAASASSWDDPELQTDILLATGVDLRRKDKRRRGRRKPTTGLTDISSIRKNTARKRLASKIFNERTMRRVADSMDAVDDKRNSEKFANSFRSTFRR